MDADSRGGVREDWNIIAESEIRTLWVWIGGFLDRDYYPTGRREYLRRKL